MDVSKIYQDYINRMNQNTVRKVSSATSAQKTDSATGSSTGITDNSTLAEAAQLNLNSSTPDLSGYLNYGSSGNYSNLNTLAGILKNNPDAKLADVLKEHPELLQDNSQQSDILSSLTGNGNNSTLTDFLGGDSSNSSDGDSMDSFFNSIADVNTKYANYLIQGALYKMAQAASKNKPDTQQTTPEEQSDTKSSEAASVDKTELK